MSTGEPKDIQFSEELLTRPRVGWGDVVATLRHFAIVTYAIPPERLRPHVDARFDLETISSAEGKPLALVSMVPFEDQDFHFGFAPWLQFRFGQTNYRSYVIDRETGRRAVWFFGTTLDSWSVTIPRYWWKLPWHRGRIRFDCLYDTNAALYERYAMTTRGGWAPVELELADSGEPVSALTGFPSLEAGLVLLTHPLMGVYYRRDGRLGSYSIWHDRLKLTTGRCLKAKIDLFDSLGLVPFEEQARPHSVLMQRETEFTIYLPPKRLSSA